MTELLPQGMYLFVFEPMNSNMYMMINKHEALMIDPHRSESANILLRKNNVNKVYIMLTHEHFDHTSGIPYYSNNFDTVLICQEECAKSIAVAKNNRPLLLALISKGENANFTNEYPKYACIADVVFSKEYTWEWQGKKIHMISSPGHSKGSCCIQYENDVIFTGDSWIQSTPVITRFPGGDRGIFEKITVPFLENLCNETLILPGHGNPFFKKDDILKY